MLEDSDSDSDAPEGITPRIVILVSVGLNSFLSLHSDPAASKHRLLPTNGKHTTEPSFEGPTPPSL